MEYELHKQSTSTHQDWSDTQRVGKNAEAMENILDVLEELWLEAMLTQYYNQHAKEKQFKVGDLVFKKVEVVAQQNAVSKLAHTWDKPYKINKQVRLGAYQLQTYSGEDVLTWMLET